MNDGIAQRLRAAGETDPTALRLTLRELLQLHGEASGAVLDDTFELTCRYNVDRLGGDQP